MTRLPIFIFLLITIICKSQTWCAPGAIWQYTIANGAFPYSGERGVHQLSFSHTVIIDGQVCDRLKGVGQGTANGKPWTNNNYSRIDLYEQNGVLFYWQGYPGEFDTLANLNAVPGEGWYCRANDTTLKKLLVTDTMYVNINGSVRKKLIFDSVPAKSYIEGIGFTYDFFHPYVWTVPEVNDMWNWLGNFKCYRDDNIGVYKTDPNWLCKPTTVGWTENEGEKTFQLFPNPVMDKISIHTDTPGFIIISDVAGKELLRKPVNAGLTEFDAELSVAGIYYLSFHTKEQIVRRKLVKL